MSKEIHVKHSGESLVPGKLPSKEIHDDDYHGGGG